MAEDGRAADHARGLGRVAAMRAASLGTGRGHAGSNLGKTRRNGQIHTPPYNGTPNPDETVGTDEGEFFFGDAGVDEILGKGGGDNIKGEPDGNDLIDGEDGNDQLFGGNGDDKIEGKQGRDDMDGEDGADVMDGGKGDCWVADDIDPEAANADNFIRFGTDAEECGIACDVEWPD